MNEKINLQDLIDLLRRQPNMEQMDADAFVRAFWETIEEGLLNDGIVKVKGLGTFKLVGVESRESINVNTGERFEIQQHSKITFMADSSMRNIINKPFAHFESVVLNEGTVFDDIEENVVGEPNTDTETGEDAQGDEVPDTERNTEDVSEGRVSEDIIQGVPEFAAQDLTTTDISDTDKSENATEPAGLKTESETLEVTEMVGSTDETDEMISTESQPDADETGEDTNVPAGLAAEDGLSDSRSHEEMSGLSDERMQADEEGERNETHDNGEADNVTATDEELTDRIETVDSSVNEEDDEDSEVVSVEKSADTAEEEAGGVSDNQPEETVAEVRGETVDETLVSAADEMSVETYVETRDEDTDGACEETEENESDIYAQDIDNPSDADEESSADKEVKDDSEEITVATEEEASDSTECEDTVETGMVQPEGEPDETLAQSARESTSLTVKQNPDPVPEKKTEGDAERNERFRSMDVYHRRQLSDESETSSMRITNRKLLFFFILLLLAIVSIGNLVSWCDTRQKRIREAESEVSATIENVVPVMNTREETHVVVDTLEQKASMIAEQEQKAESAVALPAQKKTATSTGKDKKQEKETKGNGGVTKQMLTTRVKGKETLADTVEYEMVGVIGQEKVRPGDTLAKFAFKYYGNRRLWQYIAVYNKAVVKNPDNVPVGTVLQIPQLKLKQ